MGSGGETQGRLPTRCGCGGQQGRKPKQKPAAGPRGRDRTIRGITIRDRHDTDDEEEGEEDRGPSNAEGGGAVPESNAVQPQAAAVSGGSGKGCDEGSEDADDAECRRRRAWNRQGLRGVVEGLILLNVACSCQYCIRHDKLDCKCKHRFGEAWCSDDPETDTCDEHEHIADAM
eukprot:692020-Rhodomonas_salina.1